MAQQIGSFWTWAMGKLFPGPAVEFLVGETGCVPTVGEHGQMYFSLRADLFVQQLLHEHNPGGTQTFPLDVWVKIPNDHYAVFKPNVSEWTGGRLVDIPRFLSPGWSGELSITCFNAHPKEPAGLPAGRLGFELILTPATGCICATDKQ